MNLSIGYIWEHSPLFAKGIWLILATFVVVIKDVRFRWLLALVQAKAEAFTCFSSLLLGSR